MVFGTTRDDVLVILKNDNQENMFFVVYTSVTQ